MECVQNEGLEQHKGHLCRVLIMFIRRRLIILTILPVVLSSLTIFGVLVITGRTLLLKRDFEYQKSLAGRLAWEFYTNHFVRVRDKLLHEGHFFKLVPEPGYEVLTLTQQGRHMKELLEEMPEVSQLVVLDVSGWQELKLVRLLDNKVISERDFANEAESKEFATVMEGKVYLSPVFIWQGASHVEIAIPIKDAQNRTIKVVKTKVNLEKLWGSISWNLPTGFICYMVDNRGSVIVHPERPVTLRTRNISYLKIIQDFLSGEPCNYVRRSIYESVTGEKVIGSYAQIPETGWALVIEQPIMGVYKPLFVVLAVGGGITLFFLAGSLSWGILSARKIAGSINDLKEGARRIGSGERGYRLKMKTMDEHGQLAEELDRMADLLEERNKAIHQANKEMRSLLHTFTSLVQAVSHSSSTEEVLQVTLKKAVETAGALGGEVFLFDEQLLEMVPFVSEGLDKEFFLAAKGLHFNRGIGFPGMVYESGEPVYAEDLTADPSFLRGDVARQKGYVSALYVPLRVKEKIHGCLGVISKERVRYSPNIVSILEAMSTVAASFLESAQNYRDLEGKTQELTRKVETLRVMTEIDRSILLKLNNLDELFEGVTHLLGRLIPCNSVTIFIVDRARGGFVYHYGWGTRVRKKGDFVPFEHTNATQVVEEKRPILRNEIRQLGGLLPLDKQFLEEGCLSDLRIPILLENEVIGLLNIGNKRAAGFRMEDVHVAEAVAGQLAVAFSHSRLIQRLKDSLLDTVRCLSEAIDAKSHWTKGHSERVAELACAIAKELGLEEEEIERIRMAALLHDVGKIGTFEGLLDKEGALTPEEWNLIKEHCAKGVQIISPVERFNELIPMILYHHEQYDGKSYPEGLKGEQIPLGARVVGLADAVDAMSSERPYRKARPTEEVIQELKKHAGTQFCPRVVEAALKVLGRQSNGA